jgi:hypothetical protein
MHFWISSWESWHDFYSQGQSALGPASIDGIIAVQPRAENLRHPTAVTLFNPRTPNFKRLTLDISPECSELLWHV